MVRYWEDKKAKRGFPKGRAKRYRSPILFTNQTESKPKRSISYLKTLKIGLPFIFLFALIYFFLFSSTFNVSDVIIEGNNLLKTEEVQAKVSTGVNIFRLSSEDEKARLLALFPEIKSVEIYKGIPNALKVTIVERDGKLIWQSGEAQFLISSQGEVARRLDEESKKQFADLPLVIDKKNLPVTPGIAIVSPHFIGFTNSVYGQFQSETNIKPTAFEVEDTTFDVILRTEGGFFVKFNTMRSSTKQLENLRKVLAEKRPDIHEYVDLRVDGWAYYK